jgi:outer membrane protein TolC
MYMRTPKKVKIFSSCSLCLALLTIPAYAQQTIGVVKETEFDIAADALIREVEDPASGPSFSVMRQDILRLFSSLPPVVQQKIRVDRYGEKLNQIDAKWYPQVSLSAGFKSYQRDSRSLGSTQPLGGSVQQQIWDFGATETERRGIVAERDAQQFAIRTARSETLLKCINATLALQKARRLEFFVLGFVNTRKVFAEFMVQKREVGAVSDIDVVRAKAKVAQALEQIPAARAEVERAVADYQAIFGQMPVGVSYKYYTLPIVNLNISDEQVKDIAKDLPSVKAQRSLVDSTITKVELLKQRQYGVISGQYSFSGGETAVAGYSRQNTFSIEYNVQVFDGFKARSAISEAALESYEQVLELDQIQRDQVLALANAKSRFDSSRETLKNRVDLLKSTRAVDAGTRELFTLSRASITDVFREQEAHFSAASQVIDAVFLRDISVYQYLHVLDRLLPTFELEI